MGSRFPRPKAKVQGHRGGSLMKFLVADGTAGLNVIDRGSHSIQLAQGGDGR